MFDFSGLGVLLMLGLGAGLGALLTLGDGLSQFRVSSIFRTL